MSKARLIELARNDMEHGRKGTIAQANDILRVPVENYFARDRWNAEMQQVFRRMPLMLATTAELREAGAYKAMEAAGVQVLITRTQRGQIKAFVNMCSRRLGNGAPVHLPVPRLDLQPRGRLGCGVLG